MTISPTGRYLILLEEGYDSANAAVDMLKNELGLSPLLCDYLGPPVSKADRDAANACVFPHVGGAVVHPSPCRVPALHKLIATGSPFISIEPERLIREDVPNIGHSTALPVFDESRFTWGLQVTKVPESPVDGNQVNVCIVDSGIDLTHPDFENRNINWESFVLNESVEDLYGHGTHCTGIACGPADPAALPRYGVAGGATVHVAKVMTNDGMVVGGDGELLHALAWALAKGCRIASLSIGSPCQPGELPSPAFEAWAQRALAAGMIIVAAAGNCSNRAIGRVDPISHPANCRSIIAVGAVCSDLTVSNYSNAGGGEINVVAPGDNILSSWPIDLPPPPAPGGYYRDTGTSMAAPYVAGIAALWAQSTGETGQSLFDRLALSAMPLAQSPVDVGAGLVQAPTK